MKKILAMALVLMMVLAAGAAMAEEKTSDVVLTDTRTASYEWEIPGTLSSNFTNTQAKRIGQLKITGKDGAEKPLIEEGAKIEITMLSGSGKDAPVIAQRLGQVYGMVLANTSKHTMTVGVYMVGKNGTGFVYDGIDNLGLTMNMNLAFQLTDEEQNFFDTFISATPFQGSVTFNCAYVPAN